MSARHTDALVEAVACRIVELLDMRLTPSRLLTVGELAEYLSVAPDYVYTHALELRGMRLGTGPKAPWRFRLDEVHAVLTTSSKVMRSSVESRVAPELVDRVPKRDRRRSRGGVSGIGVPLLPVRGSRTEG